MTTVFHAWSYARFIQDLSFLRRKKLHRMNQGYNFLGGSFSNRDKVRIPIQFWTVSQPQNLKRWFFHKSRPFHFHINSTSVIRPVKWNQLSFSSIPAPIHSISLIKFNIQRQLQSLPQVRCLITFRVGISIISTGSNITDNMIRKVINI